MANEPTPAPPPAKPFNEAVVDAASEMCLTLLARHPELRGLRVVFDWAGPLNDAPGLAAGVARGRAGMPAQPAELIGGLYQTIKVAGEQLERVLRLNEAFHQEAVRLGEEVIRLRDEKQRLQDPGV